MKTFLPLKGTFCRCVKAAPSLTFPGYEPLSMSHKFMCARIASPLLNGLGPAAA